MLKKIPSSKDNGTKNDLFFVFFFQLQLISIFNLQLLYELCQAVLLKSVFEQKFGSV